MESPIDRPSPKWYQLNAAQWVTVLTVVCGGVVSITVFSKTLDEHDKDLIALHAQVENLNNQGTQASRMTLQRDQQMIVSMDQRLQKLEDVSVKIQLLAQTVDTIKLDVKDVKADLKEVKERPNDYRQPNAP